MTVLDIATVGDPVLRQRAPEVERHHLDGFLQRVAPYVREATA